MSAGSSAEAAELAQVQRMPPVMPPLCNWGVVAADTGEQAAETAKANADLTANAAKNTEKIHQAHHQNK